MIFGGISRNVNNLYSKCYKFALLESGVADIRHVKSYFSDEGQKVFPILLSGNAIGLSRLGDFPAKHFHCKVTSTLGLKPVILNQFLCLSPIQAYTNMEQRRSKHSKKSTKRPEYESDSDSDDEEDSSHGAKVITVRVQSLRLDGLLKKALNIARNKVEATFYEGNIRVNGKKPNKKSFQLRIGDEVDLIQGVSPLNPEFLSVSRVEVVTVKEEDKEDDDNKLLVKIKRFKNLYIENYESDPWKKGSSME